MDIQADTQTSVIQDKEKVQGFFLIEDVNYVKKEKGPKGFEKLQKLVPKLNLNKISAVRKYPLSQEIELLKAMAIVLYGNDSPESWFELGRHDLNTVITSSLGKVMLALIGDKLPELVKNGGRIVTAFVPFVNYNFEKLSETDYKIIIENDPYPKEYYLGSFTAAVEISKTPATVSVEDLGNKKHVYLIHIEE